MELDTTIKPQKQSSKGLQYVDEHLSCENYMNGEQSIIDAVEIKAGKYIMKEDTQNNALVFILSGEIDISTGGSVCQRVKGKQLFMVCAGDSFHGKTITNTVLIGCIFNRDMLLCNRFSIEKLQEFLPTVSKKEKKEKRGITLLPIHDLLYQELELTSKLMHTGMFCIHFQNMKKELFFMELRGLYRKEDLALLFAPILGNDNDFKDQVLTIYPQVETSQELMDKLNMSPTAFKRKFKETFGMSARQWLIRKKEQKIIRDLLMTNISIAELADKYRFTVNYMTTFCKAHFGKSPTELRTDYKRRNQPTLRF